MARDRHLTEFLNQCESALAHRLAEAFLAATEESLSADKIIQNLRQVLDEHFQERLNETRQH